MGKKKKGRKGKGGGKKDADTAEDAERVAMRLELSREIQMGDLSAKLQRVSWRKKMLRMNMPVMKEDVQVAWRSFDRALDNKDYSISILMDAIAMAKDEKRRSDNLHTYQVDRMLELYKVLLQNRDGHFESTVQNAVDLMREQTDKLEEDQTETENYLRTVVFSTKQKADELIESINNRNMCKNVK